jgi:uncharacterized protein YoxC
MLIIVIIVFLLLAGCLIPLFLQLWRAAKGMSILLETLNQTLPTILKNVQEITTNVNQTTTTVHRRVEDLSLTLKKIQGTISLLAGVEEILRRNVRLSIVRKIRTSVAVAKGARIFIDHLLSKRT